MGINKESLKGTVILLLTVLNKREMYGYELIKEIEQSSDGVFLMKEGTLYPILHTLEAEGWLDSSWSQHDGANGNITGLPSEAGALREKTKEWIKRTAVDTVIGEGS